MKRSVLWMVFGALASIVALAVFARLEPRFASLGWFVLVPFTMAVDRAERWWHVALISAVMTMGFVAAVFAWFAAAIASYIGAPWELAFAALLTASPLLEPQFAVYAVVRFVLRKRNDAPARIAVVSACAYIIAEWVVPKLFGDTLGQGLYASRTMRQAADLGGAPLLTFVMLIANEATLACVRQRTLKGARKPLLVALGLALALSLYGLLRVLQIGEAPEGKRFTAGLIQANLTQYGRLAETLGTYDATVKIIDTHVMWSQPFIQRHVDLLVWPETVYPTSFGAPKSDDGAELDQKITTFVRNSGMPLLFGAYDSDGAHEYNAAFLVEPDGTTKSYRKVHVFPFTEYVPRWLDAVRQPWMGTWTAGDLVRTFDVGGTVIAPMICYDVLDPGFARAAANNGAEVFVTISNDSWFPSGDGPRLHLMQAAMRSIETRRPQLRATNSGISAVIDATGDVTNATGFAEAGALFGDVRLPRNTPWTLALALGNWVPWASLVGALFMLVWPVLQRRRL